MFVELGPVGRHTRVHLRMITIVLCVIFLALGIYVGPKLRAAVEFARMPLGQPPRAWKRKKVDPEDERVVGLPHTLIIGAGPSGIAVCLFASMMTRKTMRNMLASLLFPYLLNVRSVCSCSTWSCCNIDIYGNI